MTWFKSDDRLHDHRKTRRALRTPTKRRDAAAMGLWVLAGTWSAGNETDGFVPTDELPRWDDDAETLAGRLVESGLWHEAEQDGEPGYQFHAWAEFQPTRAQLEAKRESARERMRSVRANGEGTSRDVRSTPTRPDPTIKNTPAAAAAESEDFVAFWQAYPRSVGKAAAAKAYAKALRSTTPAAILAGLDRAKAGWAAAQTEPRFIPHPATWLNGGRWEDQPELPADLVAPTVVRRTPRQCADSDPHAQHPWETNHGHPHQCLGVSA